MRLQFGAGSGSLKVVSVQPTTLAPKTHPVQALLKLVDRKLRQTQFEQKPGCRETLATTALVKQPSPGQSLRLDLENLGARINTRRKYPLETGGYWVAMPQAFVLVNADLGAEEDLLKKLREIANVKEVYVVYGVYDIVARVEADTMEKVKETITWNIRRLDKVRSTLTMIVVDA
jgi:hypothetical protein